MDMAGEMAKTPAVPKMAGHILFKFRSILISQEKIETSFVTMKLGTYFSIYFGVAMGNDTYSTYLARPTYSQIGPMYHLFFFKHVHKGWLFPGVGELIQVCRFSMCVRILLVPPAGKSIGII